MGGTGLSCGSKMAKYFLFLFNIIFWLIGAVILGVGIWVLVDQRALNLLHVATIDSENGDALIKGAAITFIVVGLIVFVTGFFGCWGALKENACLLLMYAIIVGFILFLQIVAGILGAVFKDQILSELGTSMNDTVQNKYMPFTEKVAYPDGITQSYDFVQKEFECCGALKGPEDWQTSQWFGMVNNRTGITVDGNSSGLPTMYVPDACCLLKDKNAQIPEPVNSMRCQAEAMRFISNGSAAGPYNNVWTQGCRNTLEDWVKGHAGMLIGIAFGLAAIQAWGVILACCLRNAIRKGYETV